MTRKPAVPPELETLPWRSAVTVQQPILRQCWRDLLREARTSESVAVTRHSRIDVVIVLTYARIAEIWRDATPRRQAVSVELAQATARHLAVLQAPDVRARIDAALEARGALWPRPKAGSFF